MGTSYSWLCFNELQGIVQRLLWLLEAMRRRRCWRVDQEAGQLCYQSWSSEKGQWSLWLSTNKFHRISQGHCLCAQQSIILIHRVHGLKIETLLRRSMRKLKKTILIWPLRFHLLMQYWILGFCAKVWYPADCSFIFMKVRVVLKCSFHHVMKWRLPLCNKLKRLTDLHKMRMGLQVWELVQCSLWVSFREHLKTISTIFFILGCSIACRKTF